MDINRPGANPTASQPTFQEGKPRRQADGETREPGHLVLCVDAGGTSCKAVLMSSDGEVASSVGGPCNVTTTGLHVAIATISKAVQDALDNHPTTRGQSLPWITFSRVWVGMAGYDRLSLQPRINAALSELFRLTVNNGLRVTSDIDLLPAALTSKKDITSVIVLVVGTGSVAMSYTRDGDAFKRIGRVGGWGRILGDDGSGYATGREGIRRALRQCDLHRLRKSVGKEPASFPPLPKAILEHFQSMYPECDAENLLSTLLVPPPETEGQEDGDVTRTKNIASAASIVLSLANEDAEARKIVDAAAASVGVLVEMLVREQEIDVARCALVLGGGLMGNSTYQESVLNDVQHGCGIFNHTEYVDQPAMAGASYLLDSIIQLRPDFQVMGQG